MNILVIALGYPPSMGGGSTRANNVVKGLISMGHDVTVITGFPRTPFGEISERYKSKIIDVECEGSLRIFRVWVPSLASRGLARRLILFISFLFSSLFALPFVKRVDVIWAANPNIFSVYSAFVYALFKRCPIVQNVDDLWPEEIFNLGMLKSGLLKMLGEFIAKISYATASAITPVSPGYLNTIIGKYEVEPKKLFIIPSGVDLDHFNYVNDFDNGNNYFKVLYIGSLSQAYDFNCVLNAAKLLSSENNIKFIIQGAGELSNSLKNDLNLMELQNVDIILKVVNRKEVAKILCSADALLLPLGIRNYTGISSKLYEYQAAGKPIICCSDGEPARYVNRTKSGIVVQPGNPNELADAVLKLMNDKELAKNLGKNGRDHVYNNLTYNKIGKHMLNVFLSVF